MSNHLKDIILKIWRQNGPQDSGRFETYKVDEISDEASFLEMLDYLNEQLITDGKEAIVFDHDCREGICGTCSLMINGQAHGPERSTATCQLHMRKFSSGAEIVIEPWRAAAFPIIKDLMVDRSAFDRIIESGGFITSVTGGAPDANLIPIPKPVADSAMDSAACIGCGACADVCDGVMDKMGYDKGLVRYATQNALRNHWDTAAMLKRVFRPRVLVYTAILWTLIIALGDLIVMASHGRKGIKRVLLGSETQNVLTHSTVPVLVLR